MGAAYGSFPFSVNLLNGSAKSMAVNGSSSSQTFSYSPSTPVEIGSISVLLQHSGTTSFNVFGALGSALTNGVLLQASINGTTQSIATIKDNSDMCTHFQSSQFGNGGVLSLLSIVTPQGFGNTNNVFVGAIEFCDFIFLQSGDSISAVIQDNLSSVNFFQMRVIGINLV